MTDRELKRKRFLMLSAAALLFGDGVGFAVSVGLDPDHCPIQFVDCLCVCYPITQDAHHALDALAGQSSGVEPWHRCRSSFFVLAIGVFVGSMALVIPPTIEQGERVHR